jgi:hypothetical protein
MTYAQAHSRFPDLAAASGFVVNPNRKVWVVTSYLPRPLSGWLGGGWTYVTNVGRFVEVAQGSAVIDAATGQEPDSCSGCAAVPPPRHAHPTSDGVPRALRTLFQRSVYGSQWPPPSMARWCKPQRQSSAPAAWCSDRPGLPSMYFDGHVLNGWGWTPHQKLQLLIDRFGHGPSAGRLSHGPVALFSANGKGQFALVSPRTPACGAEKLTVRPRLVALRKAQAAATVWAPDMCY